MEGIRPQSGLVAYLDILGYTNLLKANAPEEVLGKVVEILRTLPNTLRADYADKLSTVQFPFPAINLSVKRIKYATFSDSLLLTLARPQKSTNAAQSSEDAVDLPLDGDSFAFLWYVSGLWTALFAAGLPCRGAVTSGHFVVRRTAFAGACIVEAYEQAHALDLAAVVLCGKEEGTFLAEPVPLFRASFRDANLIRVQVPMKDGKRRNALVLKPLFSGGISSISNPRGYVASKFLAFKKDLDAGAIAKLTNTEMLFHLIAAREREEKQSPSLEKA